MGRLKETVHVQSKEFRVKVIDRFCKILSISSLLSVFIYIYLKIYLLSILTGFIGALFLLFTYLNKRGFYKISRTAIIATTNIGVLFFSLMVGYNSGMYLYLFVAPLLVYLLYDYTEKNRIITVFIGYIVAFIIMSFNPALPFTFNDKQLSNEAIRFIYSFNFCSAFISAFGLITYFAHNNQRYIINLVKQQEQLLQEVALRNKSEELLKRNVKDRELLLAEIHHRVKNNLAIISGLINLQIDNVEEQQSKQAFTETKNRIYAMSLIHNMLYQNNSFAKIDFVNYVNSFCEHFSETYQTDSKIAFVQSVEDVEMDMKTAIPLALILNELVTNSFKHAFKNQNTGKISIGLKAIEDKKYSFWISDTGTGMNDNILAQSSMGMDIVKSLVEQIDGKIKYENCNGSNFTIILPFAN